MTAPASSIVAKAAPAESADEPDNDDLVLSLDVYVRSDEIACTGSLLQRFGASSYGYGLFI